MPNCYHVPLAQAAMIAGPIVIFKARNAAEIVRQHLQRRK